MMSPISDRMQFGNFNLLPSGEAAVEGYGLGRSLGSSSWNRTLEKSEEDIRVDLGV